MTRKEQLLLFLAADDKPVDPIRVQEGLFVYTQRVNEGRLQRDEELFNFEPASFGPCDMAIYDLLRGLVAVGLVSELPVPGETWKRYQITNFGRGIAQEIIGRAPPESSEFLSRIRQWCDQQSFTSLLRAVYHDYPQFAARSVLPHLRPNG